MTETPNQSEALEESIVTDRSVVDVQADGEFLKILRVKPHVNGDLFNSISRHGSWSVDKVRTYSHSDNEDLMVVIRK